ncbi:MAG: hypothetical protein ACR2P6_04750 [Gammaproteobacteria bacterium]
MPRKTKQEESLDYLTQLMQEAKDILMTGITSTRQPERRHELLKEIDALDRVEARLYNMINGVKTDAA